MNMERYTPYSVHAHIFTFAGQYDGVIHVNKWVMDGEYTSVYQWLFERFGCMMTSKLTFCVGFL